MCLCRSNHHLLLSIARTAASPQQQPTKPILSHLTSSSSRLTSPCSWLLLGLLSHVGGANIGDDDGAAVEVLDGERLSELGLGLGNGTFVREIEGKNDGWSAYGVVGGTDNGIWEGNVVGTALGALPTTGVQKVPHIGENERISVAP